MLNKLKQIHLHAAGIDIGAEKIFVCAEDGSYKIFGCFTSEFCKAAGYLKQQQIQTVAMEATGVYWVALKDKIEQQGIEVVLVKAGDAKQLPGRDKTDGEDCQWIRTLHQHGLLRPCFIPEQNIVELRTYIRTRQDHIEMAAAHVQHMQKAFTLMNIRLHQVIAQINGVSGLRIVQAILEGERDAEKLVLLCDKQILKTKREQVIASLEGNYKAEYLFMLGQAFKAWQFYNGLIEGCDEKINEWLDKTIQGKTPLKTTTPAKPIRHHKPRIDDLHQKMFRLTQGHDASQLPGMTDYTFLRLIAEVGTDLSRFKTANHFAAWLGLAPKKHNSGKIKRRQYGSVNTVAGQLFKECAWTLLKSSKVALGNFGRRIRAKKGPAVAIKAMARKLAIMFYNVMIHGMQYVENGIEKYEQQIKQTELNNITKWAQRLGLQVSNPNPEEVHQ
jgi:transposase